MAVFLYSFPFPLFPFLRFPWLGPLRLIFHVSFPLLSLHLALFLSFSSGIPLVFFLAVLVVIIISWEHTILDTKF